MKKLMIAAAIVCAAAFAQAAAISWTVSGVADAPKSTVGIADECYCAYIFLSDGADMNATTTLDAVLAAFKDGNFPEDTLPVAYADVKNDGTAVLSLSGLDVTGASDGSPVTLSAMAVIFDSWNSDPTDDSAPVWSDYQVLTKDFEFVKDTGLMDSSVAANDWQAVPEPTTGLLMLIGMGALALRRRRA